MRRTDLIVAVDPPSGPDASELVDIDDIDDVDDVDDVDDIDDIDDVVVSLVPESWDAARLVGAVSRTRNLVRGLVVLGWCRTRELRLVRGRDVDRLGRVADLVASALHPPACRHPLTLTDVPDGQRLFDEFATGRKVVVIELVRPGPEAVQRWLRVLAAAAERVVDAEVRDTGGAPRGRHPA